MVFTPFLLEIQGVGILEAAGFLVRSYDMSVTGTSGVQYEWIEQAK